MIIALITGCLWGQNDAQAIVELNTQVGEEIRYLDPQRSTGISSAHITINLFHGLYEYGHKDGEPVPALAKSMKPNADFSEYIVELKKGYHWVQNQGGTIKKQREIKAEDVVYSFRRILSPQLASEYAYMLFILKNGKKFFEGQIKDPKKVGVEAIGPYTVKITLEGPVPTFVKYLPHHSFAIVPKEPIEKHQDAWIQKEHIWTSGPFAFQDWRLKDRITIVKNPHYPEASSVQVDKVNFKFIGTYSAEAVRSFRAGEIDLDYQDPPVYEMRTLKKSGRLIMAPQLGTYFFRININKPGLGDARVRRALALTVPREKITRYILKAGQKPAYSLIPNVFTGYQPRTFGAPKTPEKARIEEAKRLMKEAGHTNGQGIPEISLVYNTAETHKKIAVVVAKAWSKHLGIKVKPLNEEWRVYLKNQHALNYQIQRAGWIADMDDPMSFAEMFISKGGNNNTGFTDAKYDQLINQARVEGDANKRNQYLAEAEGILMESLPIIPVFSYVSISLKQKYVSGFYPNKFDQHPLRFVKVDTALKKKTFNR